MASTGAGSAVERTQRALDRVLGELDGEDETPGVAVDLAVDDLREVYRAMLLSRALDVAARQMKADGRGYYTISSAGHEYAAIVGHLLRPTDPAFLHYRSGAFVAARRQDDPAAFAHDTVVSFQASTTDPISAGRHKVWGSRDHWIPPQTSTIASHIPKAVGTAIALGRAGSGRLAPTALTKEVGADAIAVCTFGDASLNHATTGAGFTMARWARRQGAPVPILFVVEDNGLGISVPTPKGWVESTCSSLPGIRYSRADGDLGERFAAVTEAVQRVRSECAPVILHLPTVRLWGHAGSDVEAGYRSRDAIAAAEAADPLVEAARWLVATGAATGEDLRQDREAARELVAAAVEAAEVRHVASTAEVVGPVAWPEPPWPTLPTPAAGERRDAHAAGLPEEATPAGRRTLGARLNQALTDVMLAHPEALVFGEDVGAKGGVYGVTAGLQERFGTGRVFDTLLDETAILGAAQGFGLTGYLPIPEVQYLAYLHNALDQIRGEAASTAWFSDGQFATPMVLRVAAFAYQKGFGGHFHNDNAIGALRDIPGLLLAAPSRGDDAVRMLRSAAGLAANRGRVVGFLEPIALYHQRDLHTDGDGSWLTEYPVEGGLWPGTLGVYPAGETVAAAPTPVDVDATTDDIDDAADVLVVTYANGVPMALRGARGFAEQGPRVRVADLRWLQPLPLDLVAEQANQVSRVLVVDECRGNGGGVADAIVAGLVARGVDGPIATVTAEDSYVPLGPAASQVLVTQAQVTDAITDLAAR